MTKRIETDVVVVGAGTALNYERVSKPGSVLWTLS